jgi:hypothetical protein
MVSDNIPNSRHHGAAKHGDALLAGFDITTTPSMAILRLMMRSQRVPL